ncbi:hypothetical protein KBY57_09160 [Cyanobium sp. Aljojuca 7D2]|uniref:hypothetical protein n=1 Tax=Cyanobium sp. Aljojuca 7D2 TaxID=2823698 RepID=UPI0020CE9A04|nr:hypothetical protein [Cyanobium sp. Aljojuca 7D2]MCP9891219.1 hypothetical protein [Cyanobium sp. Aljojuca 7D2]
MDAKKGLLIIVSLAAVGGVIAAAAVTYKSPTDQLLERVKEAAVPSPYCQALAEQHRQHRNASEAMGRELDAQTAGHNFDYAGKTSALSDAMYESLKRDNNCP